VSYRTSTIARMAAEETREYRRMTGQNPDPVKTIAASIQFYQLTEQMVTEAYKTTSLDPRD